jgi:hypothetical protein
MKAKLVSVTELEGKPIWFRTYEFECIDCGKHFTRRRFDSRTNPYCPICHRKHENERQRERIARKEQQKINEILDKISAEIKELPELHCIQVMDREDIPLLALDIIEKYKGDSE